MGKMKKILDGLKKKPNDEFYTRRQDVDRGLAVFLAKDPDLFRDKIVYLPCDDVTSNFTLYFLDNFQKLGLKKIVATSYNKDGAGSYFEFDGTKTTKQNLQGNGDFRSDEIKNIWLQADFIVTNPPFSLYREFFKQCQGKDYIILSPRTALTYSVVFPKIKDGTAFVSYFYTCHFLGKGNGSDCHFISNKQTTESRPFKFAKYNDVKNDLKYIDNTNILNVEHIKDIPDDYTGTLAASVYLLCRCDLSRLNIISLKSDAKINGNWLFKRVIFTVK